jgi:hypothetical protein
MTDNSDNDAIRGAILARIFAQASQPTAEDHARALDTLAHPHVELLGRGPRTWGPQQLTENGWWGMIEYRGGLSPSQGRERLGPDQAF